MPLRPGTYGFVISQFSVSILTQAVRRVCGRLRKARVLTAVEEEGHLLQLCDGVDGANEDTLRHVEWDGSIVEYRPHAAAHEHVGQGLGARGRDGQECDIDRVAAEE